MTYYRVLHIPTATYISGYWTSSTVFDSKFTCDDVILTHQDRMNTSEKEYEVIKVDHGFHDDVHTCKSNLSEEELTKLEDIYTLITNRLRREFKLNAR